MMFAGHEFHHDNPAQHIQWFVRYVHSSVGDTLIIGIYLLSLLCPGHKRGGYFFLESSNSLTIITLFSQSIQLHRLLACIPFSPWQVCLHNEMLPTSV